VIIPDTNRDRVSVHQKFLLRGQGFGVGIKREGDMAIVAGVNIPDNKRIEISLRSIYGIGPSQARNIAKAAGLDGNPRVSEITETDLDRIRELVDRDRRIEGDLRREVNMNIRRLIDISSYRGTRHRRGLPVRGQRTRTNARSKRGRRKAVAGRRQTVTRT